MYKKILLAYDGSEPGQRALLDCHEIAQWSQAEIRLITEGAFRVRSCNDLCA